MSKQADYSRRKSEETAEIGALPEVEDAARKERCRFDLLLFLQWYFPDSTGLSPFSPDHIEFIDDLQNAILYGGRVARAVFRGFSKTTIGENTCLWAVMYGHKRFLPLVGSDQGASRNNLRSIKSELATNDRLLADFPEVCFPIRALEGKVQRCASQTLNGQRTEMSWTAEHVVLPMVPGSPASGGCLTTLGMTSFRRGLVHKSDGVQHRPDFVFIDDPQSSRSAKSETQVAEREHILSATILKSAGHKKPMSAFVAGTIICPGDLMDRLTDPDISPSWRAKRIPMMRSRAKNEETLWLERYASIRHDFDRDIPGDQQRAVEAATAFYVANRAEMDEGCEVAWQSCYSEEMGEVSAIQHAYNMLVDDGEATFSAECQNDPIREKGDLERIEHSPLEKKQNGVPRGTVPQRCEWLTAFVDVQGAALYWCVVGWEANFTGHVVDYGVWPKQRVRTLRLASIQKTLKKTYGSKDQSAVIYAGLTELFNEELAPQWKREDGAFMRLTAAAVDAGWPESGESVRSFCRDAQVGFPVMPALGRSITAGQCPMSEWPKQNGRRIGDCWVITKPAGRTIRTLLIDTNSWKTRLARAISLPQMATGSIDLCRHDTKFGPREFVEQLLAEIPTQTSGSGRTLYEWKLAPGKDNHMGDCMVGCMVLANVAGVARPGITKKPRRSGRRGVRYA